MCLILSNLLENALEASLRTAPARRQIEITAYVHAKRILLIEVVNAFDGKVNEKNGVFYFATFLLSRPVVEMIGT